MNYYIKEIQTSEGVQKTAGVKARDDADCIFKECGLEELLVENSSKGRGRNFVIRLISHATVNVAWKRSLEKLNSGDKVFIQFPCIEHSIFLSNTLKKLTEKGVEIVLLIHDLELLRIAKRKDVSLAKRVRLRIEEKNTLLCATKIIAHNESMKKFLSDMGVEEKKISVLEIFDYLIPNFSEESLRCSDNKQTDPVIIAGNLRKHKAEYAYHLPQIPRFNLYGVGYEATPQSNIDYKGSFNPNELVYAMDGSFGLVWDGKSAETCMGVYGDYLRINNPHKTSLYLAAEKPVIIWKEAALANFVKQNHCGILISSLDEIAEAIKQLSDTEYRKIQQSTQEIGKKVRNGYYLKKAVKDML